MCYESVRKKRAAARGGPCGGIACFIKNHLNNYVTRLSSENDGDLWLKFELPLSSPLFMGIIYVSPKGSSI